MKVYSLIMIVYFLNPILSNGQKSGTIHMTVDGIKDENGTLRIGLFSEQDEFLEEPSYSRDIKIDQQSEIQTSFENIPHGVYAISVYHDLNDDNILDSNFIGMPKEPVGFSNEHQPKMGPPKFNGAKFILDQEEIILTVSMYSY